MKSEWISVKDKLPNEFVTVLTQHIEDLFPVAAFLYHADDNIWLRETEGPENITIRGRHEQLYRPPTHWKPLPEPPDEI